MYGLARPLLFRLDPEAAHELTLRALRLASASRGALSELERHYGGDDPRLRVSVFGLDFPNPIGLAAGLDIPALASLGFGSVGVGSVTAVAQPGNPRPRLYRLREDEALVNRMGFNNHGATLLARRLARLRGLASDDRRRPRVPIGVNVGKSRSAAAADAERDYLAALRAVWRFADYVVYNVSSPNTPGLRDLQEREPLERLLAAADGLAGELGRVPVLVKLSPDLSTDQLRVVAEVAAASGAAGLIATNTTTTRPGLRSVDAGEAGGLSGRPLADLAASVLKVLRGSTSLPLVSVGGIFDADDVLDRLRAGASLVQLYTSFVFAGPGLPRRIKRDLLARMEAGGWADLRLLVDASR